MITEGQKTAIKAVKDDPKKPWEELASIHSSAKPGVCFNALDSLFAIQLGKDETFPALVTRVSSALAAVQNKRNDKNDIEALDAELFSLTLLRAQENGFRSALMLKDTLGRKEMIEAFKNETGNIARMPRTSLVLLLWPLPTPFHALSATPLLMPVVERLRP